MKKKILIVLIALIICFMSFKLFQYLKIKYAKIEVMLKDDLTLEFNDKKKVSDYIISINGNIKDDFIIDSSKIGEKNVKFKFINDDNIEVEYSFNINVVDTVAPLAWVDSYYNVEKGTEFKIDNILCGDNYDNKPVCLIQGDYDTNVVGEYNLVYKAEDKSGNVSLNEFVLNVYEPVNENEEKIEEIKEPNYIPFSYFINQYKNEDTEIGIDVSTWQGDIDFKKLKEAGVEFIIIRVGYSGDYDEHELDSKFKRNIKEANKYGIKVGVYFYSYAKNKKDAINEANWVIKKIKPYKVELPVVFDWEEWRSFNELDLSFFGLTNMAESFLDVVSSYGYEGMLYSSKNYLEKIWFDTDYKVWLAHYTDNTNYQGKYNYWQLSSNGSVDGINGPVDINIRYKSR